jgi:acetyl esterase/lipase
MLSVLIAATLAFAPKVEPGVTYSELAGEKGKMDIYLPDRTEGQTRPAIVVIHGGGWVSGSRNDVSAVAQKLAKEGFVVANISYRLAPAHRWPAQMEDAQTAVRFLRANAAKYGIDPSRIGSTGFSAGGHMALMLGLTELKEAKRTEHPNFSSRTQAVVNFFGPTDVRRKFPDTVAPLFVMLTGKKQAEAGDILRSASPVTYIDRASPPIFTLHGDKDPIVPVDQAHWLTEQLKKAGVVHETRIVEGLGHTIDTANPKCVEAFQAGVAWFKKHLKLQASP